MTTHYNEVFKLEVVKVYMAGDLSMREKSADYNVAKSTIIGWVKKYSEECQYKTTTRNSKEESKSAKEIRRLNQLLHEKDKEILHSDQRGLYTSWEFVDFCKDNSVTQCMGKTGYPYDNAPIERLYNTFKSFFIIGILLKVPSSLMQ